MSVGLGYIQFFAKIIQRVDLIGICDIDQMYRAFVQYSGVCKFIFQFRSTQAFERIIDDTNVKAYVMPNQNSVSYKF